MDKAFRNKVAIVTGGTSGIGSELVRQLAGYGAVVYACARSAEKGNAFVEGLPKSDARVYFCQVDVQDSRQVKRLVDQVVKEQGRIDYLFNSAGTILGGEMRDHHVTDIETLLKTNVLGTAYCAFYVYRQMAGQGYGHIVNLSSIAGLMPLPLMGIYCSSKFAVLGIGEALRIEGKGLGIRVSTATPGIVDTPIYDSGTYSSTDKGAAKGLLKRRLITIQPDKAVRRILRGTARNKAVIHTQFYARFGGWSYRYFPGLYRFAAGVAMPSYRRRIRK